MNNVPIKREGMELLVIFPQAEGLPCMLDTDTAITKERVIDLNIIRDRISLGDWDPHYLMKK